MEVYTIGFGKHTAADFFGALKKAGIRQLLDVRLNNVSQLAGFTKRDDLRYFLRAIGDIDYRHALDLAPTADLLTAYRSKRMTWAEYEGAFIDLLAKRHVEEKFGASDFAVPTVLLCSEPTATRCHRRLVAEYLRQHALPDLRVVHL